MVEDMLAPLDSAGIHDIFWTQQGEGDFIYMKPEMSEIAHCVKEYGMSVAGVAAPHVFGPMRNCWSEDALQRKTGVRLIENRMELAARLGARIVWLPAPSPLAQNREHILKSLETLIAAAEKRNVTLAVESCIEEELAFVLDAFQTQRLGWCMQTALFSLGGRMDELLGRFGNRLALVRASDATGYGLMRLLPFSGVIDWPSLLAKVKAVSPDVEFSLNVDVYSHLDCSQMEFLARAKAAAEHIESLWNGKTI
ncbi:MAG: TIM barrel protein [Victivallales bacterium]|nr:TIM barrel protein [Victivallales bacterium]